MTASLRLQIGEPHYDEASRDEFSILLPAHVTVWDGPNGVGRVYVGLVRTLLNGICQRRQV